jgi:ribosomal protein S24E
MDFKIIDEKENSLFERKEIKIKIDAVSAPSREEVRKALSEKYSVPEENIKVLNILGSFGTRFFEVNAHLYKTKEKMQEVEHLRKRDKLPEKTEEKPEEETKQSETSIEQSPEEVVEEKKEEKSSTDEPSEVKEKPVETGAEEKSSEERKEEVKTE